VGECFFWYRPTRVVPDQRPLNGRCCCSSVSRLLTFESITQPAAAILCAEGHGVTLTHPHWSSSIPVVHQSTEHEFGRHFVLKLCISSTVRRGSRRYADPSSLIAEFTLPAPVNRTRIRDSRQKSWCLCVICQLLIN